MRLGGAAAAAAVAVALLSLLGVAWEAALGAAATSHAPTHKHARGKPTSETATRAKIEPQVPFEEGTKVPRKEDCVLVSPVGQADAASGDRVEFGGADLIEGSGGFEKGQEDIRWISETVVDIPLDLFQNEPASQYTSREVDGELITLAEQQSVSQAQSSFETTPSALKKLLNKELSPGPRLVIRSTSRMLEEIKEFVSNTEELRAKERKEMFETKDDHVSRLEKEAAFESAGESKVKLEATKELVLKPKREIVLNAAWGTGKEIETEDVLRREREAKKAALFEAVRPKRTLPTSKERISKTDREAMLKTTTVSGSALKATNGLLSKTKEEAGLALAVETKIGLEATKRLVSVPELEAVVAATVVTESEVSGAFGNVPSPATAATQAGAPAAPRGEASPTQCPAGSHSKQPGLPYSVAILEEDAAEQREDEEDDKDEEDEDGGQGAWSADERAALVLALARHFFAPCVFLLFHAEESASALALWRALGARGLAAAALPWQAALLLRPAGAGARDAWGPPPLRLPACPAGRPLAVVASEAAARGLARSQRRWPGEARWLLLLAGASAARALRVLRGARLPLDCEVLVARGAGGASLREVLRPRPRAPLQLLPWGEWRPPAALRAPALSLAQRRTDLQGAQLRFAVATCPPLEYVECRGDAVEAVRGLFPRVGVEMARQLNASAKLLTWGDNDYGSDNNGSWSGMVGAAQHAEVDLVINSFLMNPTRQAVIDFTTPIVLARAGVFIREPEDASMRWGLMVAPFANHLWLCVGAALGTLAVAVAAISRLPFPAPARPAEKGPADRLSPSDALLFVWGAICNQGQERELRSPAGRWLSWVLNALAVVVMAAYGANLVASLAVQRVELPFQDLQGLVDNGVYALGVIGGLIKNFVEATDPVLKQVYQKLLVPMLGQQPKSFADGFQRVCRGRYAFMTGTHTAGGGGRGEQSGACGMTVLPSGSFPLALAMVLPPGSPLRRIVNGRLQAMRRGGVLRRLFLAEWPRLAPPDGAPRFHPVALRSVAPPLAVLGAAVAAALLLLALVERRRPRPRPRPSPGPPRTRPPRLSALLDGARPASSPSPAPSPAPTPALARAGPWGI